MSVPATDLVAEARQYIGYHEVPWGSNDGYWVRKFQSSTGAYHAPWCVSFLQYLIKRRLGFTIADRTAGVYYLVGWARRHYLVRNIPEPGMLVAFIVGQGHCGIVEKVGRTTITTIEGNAANSVLRRVRPRYGPYVFIVVPATTFGNVPAPPKPKPKPKVKKLVPRFEVVSSENGHAVVRVKWGKWSKVGPQIPALVKKYRQVRVLRKLVKA